MSEVLISTPTDALATERNEDSTFAGLKLRVKRLIVALVAAATGITIALLKFHNYHFLWYSPFYQVYSLIAGIFVLSRIILSCLYREPTDQGYLPTVSIVIAVKNEEDNIAKTVDYCFRGRYPSDLMEVIVVDDGSTDQTWNALTRLRAVYPCLRLFKFDKNRGKRHAMALGAQRSHGEILVYVDSDSFLDTDSLYKIVQPFADKTIGAVAGHIQVIIEKNNIISKMESIRYYVSHRLVKAAESVY